MNFRSLVESVRRWYQAHAERDRRIIAGVAVAVALSLAYIGVVEPIIGYRKSVADEIAEGQERLDQAERFVGALDSLRAERNDLKQKVDQARGRLLPGTTAAIGAAALQERVNNVAGTRGITVQSTQVMRDEETAPFRKVSVRLTLSGELKEFGGFLADLEYGPQALRVPFMEISRRGAAAAGKGPRALSVSLELSGYLLAKAEPEPPPAEAPAPAEGGEAAPAEGADNTDQMAPAPPAPEAPATPQATLPAPQAAPPAPQAAPPAPAPAPS